MRFVTLALAATVLATAAADAQRPAAASRRATTVAALVAYPVFFHTQQVRVRGTIASQGRRQVLRSGESAVAVAGPGIAGGALDSDTLVEVTGNFVDVGRLEAGDPRLAGVDVSTVWTDTNRSWPGVGELPLLVAERTVAADSFAAPSVRALALEPWRYTDQRVTVTGRFRGLNLYGDLPDAPRQGRWAFVLQSADSAIWVVGVRPKGEGFNLDVNARVDTGRWLEVSGVVKFERALPVVEGQLVNAGKPPTEAPPSEPAALVPAIGPDPEVVFSLPTQDETDVPVTTNVRMQFSRALDPRSLGGQVRVSYLGSQSKERGEPQSPPITFQARYDQSTNVLDIRFTEPLERFRTVRVELGDGIRAVDGAPLRSWTLTFSLGG